MMKKIQKTIGLSLMLGTFFSAYLSLSYSRMLKQGTGWVNMNPSLAPSVRRNLQITYDSESDRFILYGGLKSYYSPPSSVVGWNDTWSYDYNSNTWVEMNPEVYPSTRICAAMKYDSESDKMVLFGG